MRQPTLTTPRAPNLHNTFDFHAGRFSVLIAGEETGGHFSMVEVHSRRSLEPPVHVHEFEDETIMVLEGELEVRLGDTAFGMTVGQVVLLPRGIPHALRLRSATARLLVTYSPAGFEHFLCEVAQPITEAASHPSLAPGLLDVPRLVTVGERYGIAFYPASTQES